MSVKKEAVLQHVGILVYDLEKAKASMDMMPESGNWDYAEFDFNKDVVFLGKPYKIKVSNGVVGGIPVEVIEPVLEESQGSYMAEYMKKYGEGLHHIAFTFATEEAYNQKSKELAANGYELVLDAQAIVGEGTPEAVLVKVQYLAPPDGGVVMEINCNCEVK